MVDFVVSACLAGLPCRFDGQTRPNEFVVELVRQGRALPVCPEQLGGLPTPRSRSERAGARVLTEEGRNVTAHFRRGAKITLEIAQRYGCRAAILQALSPSCGCGVIYDGSFRGKLVQGNGVTAELLKKKGIAVLSIRE
jgi:uncharacterized protein YbbK (DUF523 family)